MHQNLRPDEVPPHRTPTIAPRRHGGICQCRAIRRLKEETNHSTVTCIILPGAMKGLLNRVTEAKNAAEANLIARREKTPAMRSQANAAKLLESSPGLDAFARAAGARKDRLGRQTQRRVGQEGLGQPRGQSLLSGSRSLEVIDRQLQPSIPGQIRGRIANIDLTPVRCSCNAALALRPVEQRLAIQLNCDCYAVEVPQGRLKIQSPKGGVGSSPTSGTH